MHAVVALFLLSFNANWVSTSLPCPFFSIETYSCVFRSVSVSVAVLSLIEC